MVILEGRPELELDIDRFGVPDALAASLSFHAGNRGVVDGAESDEEDSEVSVAAVVCDNFLDTVLVIPVVCWYAVWPLRMLVKPSSSILFLQCLVLLLVVRTQTMQCFDRQRLHMSLCLNN